MNRWRAASLALTLGLPAWGVPPQHLDIEISVQLLAPLSTQLSRKGDIVSARVLAPSEWQGGILEGEVREVRAGGGSGRKSSIRFQFQSLHVTQSVVPVTATILAITNGRGDQNMDEEGSLVQIEGTGLRLTVPAPSLNLAVGTRMLLHLAAKQE